MKQQRTAKRGPGRPAKLTLAQIEQIGQDIALGLTEEQACVRLRVNLSSFRTAKRRNSAFESVIQTARARSLFEALTDIRNGRRGWQGAAWILERRHQPQFARAYVPVPQAPSGDNGTIFPEWLDRARQSAAGLVSEGDRISSEVTEGTPCPVEPVTTASELALRRRCLRNRP